MDTGKAKKQRSLARFNWFSMKIFLKNKIIESGRQELTDERWARLDVLAGPTSHKIMEKTTFKLSVRMLKGITSDSFAPLRAFRRPRHICESYEKIAEHSAFRVLSKIDIFPAIQLLSKSIKPTPAPLRRLRMVKYKPERLTNKADSVAESAALHAMDYMQIPDLFEQIQPLAAFSCQRRVFEHGDNEDFVLNQIAASAISVPNLTTSLEMIRAPKRVLRPLLRIAYPSKDPSAPFSATRGATLSGSDDEDIISRDAFLARDEYGHKLYNFDLSHLFGIIETEEKNIEERMKFLEKDKEEVERTLRRAERKKLRHETVEESCYFVDEFLKEGLLDFTCDICGLKDSIQDAVKFQTSFAKQNLALSVSLTTFKNANIISPYLWGAANVKMHKLEGRHKRNDDGKYNTFN